MIDAGDAATAKANRDDGARSAGSAGADGDGIRRKP
jgi:hypothetical protein